MAELPQATRNRRIARFAALCAAAALLQSAPATVNYGLRWEYYPVPMRADRGIELFDPSTIQIMLCGVGGNPKTCDIQVSKRLFSPRIGLAYRPAGSWVLRAGFALNPEQINMYRDGMYSYPARYDYVATGASTYLPVVSSLSLGVPAQPEVDISSGTVGLPKGASYEAQGAVIPKNFVRGYTGASPTASCCRRPIRGRNGWACAAMIRATAVRRFRSRSTRS